MQCNCHVENAVRRICNVYTMYIDFERSNSWDHLLHIYLYSCVLAAVAMALVATNCHDEPWHDVLELRSASSQKTKPIWLIAHCNTHNARTNRSRLLRTRDFLKISWWGWSAHQFYGINDLDKIYYKREKHYMRNILCTNYSRHFVVVVICVLDLRFDTWNIGFPNTTIMPNWFLDIINNLISLFFCGCCCLYSCLNLAFIQLFWML